MQAGYDGLLRDKDTAGPRIPPLGSGIAKRVVALWLDRHPRFTFHFMLTSRSRLNAVEGFAKRRINRGVFRCVVDLEATINRFVVHSAEARSASAYLHWGGGAY